MKDYSTKDIRNVVLLGSSKSGKTTLSEAMLFEGKVIDRRGTVEDKNTVSDNTEFEQTNQKSVFASALYAEFKNTKFNIIDAPGSDDFIGGAVEAFKVCETGILLVNGTQGVEVGTEIFARQAAKYNVPLLLAVNQLDHEKANWDQTHDSIKSAFGSKAAFVQFPVNPGAGFEGFIDVVDMKYYHAQDANGKFEVVDIPAQYADEAEELRMALMEKAAEADDELMMKYLDELTLSEEEFATGLKLGIAKGEIMPVFCISAKKNIGVNKLMDFCVKATHSPEGTVNKTISGKEVACKEAAPTSIFIFKTSVEQHLGDVSYFKVMSGVLKEGADLVNPENGNGERLSAIYAVAGSKKEKVPVLRAGDIGCVMKLKAGKTDVTLAESGCEAYEHIQFPEPKYRCAIKPADKNDEAKMGDALNKIAAQDPTAIVEYSKELRQTILSGQGEQHINFVKWRLNNEFKLNVELYAPKVPYRETITKVATAEYTHKKQSGGAGQYGRVVLLVEPIVEGVEPTGRFKIDGKDTQLTIKGKEEATLDWGGKFEFVNCVVGGAIDAGFMPAIKKGIMQKMEEGPLTGSYARDIRVYIYDGKMHPVDSKEIAFIIAGRNAFKDAFKQAGPKLLEPIYLVEVMVPGDCMGDVMSDIQNRRGIIEGMGSEKGFQILKARVPLAELYKYSTTLSSLTSGRATFTMSFIEYQQVPMDVQEKLLKAYEEEEKDE